MSTRKRVVLDDLGSELELLGEIQLGTQGRVWRADGGRAVKLLYQVDPDALEQRLRIPAESLHDRRAGRDHWWVAWPLQRVCDLNRNPLGYSMPYLDTHSQGVLLSAALMPETRREVGLQVSSRWTLRAAMHLATAAWWAEDRGLHPIDLSPRNIVFGRDSALATLLDPEGIGVAGGAVPQIPDDLRPPELLQHGATTARAASRWALGVTVIQILLQGEHPFGGVPHPQMRSSEGLEQAPSTPAGNVLGGWCRLFDPSGGETATRGVRPQLALPGEVLALASKCFIEGRSDPTNRPDPASWARALDAADRELVRCPRRGRHWRLPDQDCAWCELEQITGVDPYAGTGPS